jgi:hypothetical protein
MTTTSALCSDKPQAWFIGAAKAAAASNPLPALPPI